MTTHESAWERAEITMIMPHVAAVEHPELTPMPGTYWIQDAADPRKGYVAQELAEAANVVGMIERGVDPYSFGHHLRSMPTRVFAAFLTHEKECAQNSMLSLGLRIGQIDNELAAIGGAL